MTGEKYLALDLVKRLARRFGPGSKVAKEVPGWIEYVTDVECPERPQKGTATHWWAKVRGMLGDLRVEARSSRGHVIDINTRRFEQHFGLSSVEGRILAFFAFYQVYDMFEHVVDRALSTQEVTLPFLIARFCDTDAVDVQAALRTGARLTASGLLQRETGSWSNRRVSHGLTTALLGALQAEVEDVEGLVGLLFPLASPPDAEWQDFEGLAENATLMRDLLKRSLANGTPGVNILLYGLPGTGKTEFCKVLSREVGASLRVIGDVDEAGQEPSRRERLAELCLAGRVLATRCDSVLLLDEVEDMFGGGPATFFRSDQPSKIFSNRLLETNPVPTLWTTNSISSCDPAFLRRMIFSVEMRPPTGSVRKRIWQRLEARLLPVTDTKSLQAMAEVHHHPPALVADAMRVAKLCGGNAKIIALVLGASAKLMNGGAAPLPQHHSDAEWEPTLANTDTDLARLEAKLVANGEAGRISFFLDGPAGTGKSAWARHLARRLGMPVMEKRASDILSMWVGGSEKAIAGAFADARAEGALLIFDEADSLLAGRRNSSHQWEVSQVNELLTWMESHPLPFVCTTNLAEKLDPAAQRRFTFRIRFDWLIGEQLAVAWKVHFGTTAPAALSLADRLAPGDFANVARRMRALGENDAAAVLAELMRESDAKEGKKRVIGFGR